MAKVVLKPRIGLWRIVDGRNNKPLRTSYNRAVDNGGQRTELDAHRLLKQYRDMPMPRRKREAISKEANRKKKQRLDKIARNVERQVAKREGPGIAKAKP